MWLKQLVKQNGNVDTGETKYRTKKELLQRGTGGGQKKISQYQPSLYIGSLTAGQPAKPKAKSRKVQPGAHKADFGRIGSHGKQQNKYHSIPVLF